MFTIIKFYERNNIESVIDEGENSLRRMDMEIENVTEEDGKTIKETERS